MILLDENQESELLKNPKVLLRKYKNLINHLDGIVTEVNKQIDITQSDEMYCLNEYIEHRDIISLLRNTIRKEMDMFSDYLDAIEERREIEDVAETYKKQKRLFEKLLQMDNVMYQKLLHGENEHNRAINEIQKRYKKMEVNYNAKSKKNNSKFNRGK